MSNYSQQQYNEAKLIEAIVDLANDYKADPDVLEHLSYICHRIGNTLALIDGQSEGKRLIDWWELGDKFDRQEYALHELVKNETEKTEVEKLADKIILQCELTNKHPEES